MQDLFRASFNIWFLLRIISIIDNKYKVLEARSVKVHYALFLDWVDC